MIALLIICCASVSSGWAGKPSGEWIAERLNVPSRNAAYICNALTKQQPEIPQNSLVVNLDGSYWDSYDTDCAKPVDAIRTFYTNAIGSRVAIATVPDRNAGGFYRFVCGAQSATQRCRPQINAAITEGCKKPCTLLDADALYEAHKDIADIHLTPAIWREVAEQIQVPK